MILGFQLKIIGNAQENQRQSTYVTENSASMGPGGSFSWCAISVHYEANRSKSREQLEAINLRLKRTLLYKMTVTLSPGVCEGVTWYITQ